MKVLLKGTAGPRGWPVHGCGCASCGRATTRRPTAIVLDDRVRLDLDDPVDAPEGYAFEATQDGHVIIGPDGGRLLYAPADGPPPTDPPTTGLANAADPRPFDAVLLDLLDRPARLGDLRHRGLVSDRTQVIAIHLDHRISSESELARRLDYWGARAVPDGTVLDTRRPAPIPLPQPRRTLLLGGSRSGKSEEAELRLAGEADVTYVATGPSGEDDPSWLDRVRVHRDRRPAHWRTVETVAGDAGHASTETERSQERNGDRAGDRGGATVLPHLLRTAGDVLLVDGLGTWLTAVFDECGAWPGQDGSPTNGAPGNGQPRSGQPSNGHGNSLDRVAERCDGLVEAWRQTSARIVAVSDEVGMGVIPSTASGRLFRDTLGRLNQRLAAESEEVALVVAGRLLPL